MSDVITDLVKSGGDILGRQRDAERRQAEESTARRSERTVIRQGAFRVVDGAKIAVEDGGDIELTGGGNIRVRDGGQLATYHPSGVASVWLGSFIDDGQPGYGMFVQNENGSDLFSATSRPSGSLVRIGVHPSFGGQPVGQASIDGDIVRITSHGAGTMIISSVLGGVTIGAGTDQVRVAHTTVGSGSACVIDTSGLIQRVSSSIRYKTNILPLDLPPASVLAAEPITFEDKQQATQAEDSVEPMSVPRHVGMIAEQLDECGLGELVAWNEDGSAESIRYDRLPVAQQIVLRDHEARITALEQQVAAQADLIAALSARLDALEGQ